MYKYILIIFTFISITSWSQEPIRIVGSATLYPFITIAAEMFGKEGNSTPIVESNGTGGGINLLCKSGNNSNSPDIAAASRPIKTGELKLCSKHKIKNLKELAIGFDGIVIAQNKSSQHFSLTLKELFLSMAEMIPSKNGSLIKNPYLYWNEINSNLPKSKITIYGPSSTSGTRDLINELIIKKFADTRIRLDGHYIEMPENNNLIINKIAINDTALGIISFSFLENNSEVKPILIDGILPNQKTVRNSSYPLARKLYLYVNTSKYKQKPGLKKFVNYIESPLLTGENGYLAKRGLITLEN